MKAHGILTIIAAALAAIASIAVLGGANVVPAFFAVGIGIIALIKHRDNMYVLVAGAGAILFGGLAVGAVAAGFGTFANFAGSFAIAASLAAVATAAIKHWTDMEHTPAMVAVSAMGVAVLVAFIWPNSLGNILGWQAYVITAGSLAGLYPAITALKN